MKDEKPFITRFAPSPNGWLHLGHAYSALIGARAAQAAGGQFLLRLEDIDVGRARPHFVEGIYQDLEWLGLSWPEPVMVQSARFEIYQAVLAKLRAQGLVYPCWATRREILSAIDDKKNWPRDPDGAPLYPGLYRHVPDRRRKELMWEGTPYCWRLDMDKALQKIAAPLTYREWGSGAAEIIPLDAACYGDVVLARKDAPASYHLASTLDDAAMGVSHVIRGADLIASTDVHRLLQALLGLPTPLYHHHSLICGADGKRLAKRDAAASLAALRDAGVDGQALAADLRAGRLPAGYSLQNP